MNEDFAYSSGEYFCVRARVIIHTHSIVSISKFFKDKTREFITASGNAEGAPTAIIDALNAYTGAGGWELSEFFQAISLQVYEILIEKKYK